MWRTQTTRKSRQIVNAARQLATESVPSKPNIPPPISPSPPPKSGSFRFLKFIGLSLPVAAGGLVGYAWYDQEFRKQLEDNVPYVKDLFDNILPEVQKPFPIFSERKPDAALPRVVEQVTVQKGQEQATKSGSSTTDKIASHFDTYRRAYCTTESDTEHVKPRQHHCKRETKKHHNDNQHLSASYITPSFDKASILQQTSHDASGTDEKDADTSEENEEESDMVNWFKPKNIHDGVIETERQLAEKILANRANPFHGLTAPEPVQPQGYRHFQVNSVEDLLTDDDDDLDQSPENVSGLALQKQLEPKLQDKKLDNKIDPTTIEIHMKRREDEEKADNAALEVVIHKLLTSSDSLAEEAVKAQYDVATTIRNHTKYLKQAMDDTSDILHKDAQWDAVAIAHKEREHAMLRANELVTEAKKSIEKLRDIISEGKNNKVTQQNPAIFPASKRLNELLKDLGSANMQVRQAEAEANVMQKYKDLVDKGRKQFQKEIESLMPVGKLSSGKKLSEDELNALIAHAHRRIEQLQKQIAEQMAMERQRLATALEAQRQEHAKITNATVAEECLRLQEEFEAERSKDEMEYLVRLEIEVRKQLARQAAAHSDHLKDVLAIQQEQLSNEFNRNLNLKMLEERERFQTEVAGWISRLKGIEAAIDARAGSEKLARCAQDLWLACIALNSVIHFGNDDDDEKQLVPLRNKVETILNAGNRHPFVETVANTFPSQALDRGVSTEYQLKQRFTKVSRVCRRVGLISASENSLYKYLISYLHSFVVLDNIVATTETDKVDLNTLDNFDLLAHAQYWMERGNLELALRFMCQLTGEARRAATDWINEARILLETKQVAYTLTAYASATGLANTF